MPSSDSCGASETTCGQCQAASNPPAYEWCEGGSARPTDAPTDAPTETPTHKPTRAPTRRPTSRPTCAPVQAKDGDEDEDEHQVACEPFDPSQVTCNNYHSFDNARLTVYTSKQNQKISVPSQHGYDGSILVCSGTNACKDARASARAETGSRRRRGSSGSRLFGTRRTGSRRRRGSSVRGGRIPRRGRPRHRGGAAGTSTRTASET